MGAHRARMQRAADATAAAGFDAVLVAPGPDLVYLAGYDPPPLERLTALVVRPGSDPVLIVPKLERPRAEQTGAGATAELVDWPDGGDPYAIVGELIGDGSERRVAVSDRLWAVHLLALGSAVPRAAFERGSPVLSPLRAVKDEDEIALLARAAAAADEALARITREPFEGRTEAEVAGRIRGHLIDAGCDRAAFWIVGSGPNAASPHHEPGDRVIVRGEAVVLDFGGPVDGYHSDITRTVVVGEPSEELREVHAIVERAQRAAFEAVRSGVPAEDVDRAARAVITDAGYGSAFIHRTGHGIGLEEHEDPYIVTGNAAQLVPGNAFSIEPGIYVAGRFGVRIEDVVVVTVDGARSLNGAPRALLSVG